MLWLDTNEDAGFEMKHKVFVYGQEGTTGLRIHEYLAQRADVEVLSIAAERRKDATERARLLNAADVAFLCLPDDAAREAASLVTNPRTCLIDASTAHRTAPDWVFGLPELAPGQRERISRAESAAFATIVTPSHSVAVSRGLTRSSFAYRWYSVVAFCAIGLSR